MLSAEGPRTILDLGVVNCIEGDDVLGVTGVDLLLRNLLLFVAIIEETILLEACGVVQARGCDPTLCRLLG